jgi:hypothetical protein
MLAAWLAWAVIILLGLAILGGIGWLAYRARRTAQDGRSPPRYCPGEGLRRDRAKNVPGRLPVFE